MFCSPTLANSLHTRRVRLLDVPDRNDCRGLRQLFAGVLRPDAVDVVLAALGETVGGLHPALGDEDAEIGSLEAVVARSIDAQEKALILVCDGVPIIGYPDEPQRSVVIEVPGTGARCCQD